MEGKRERESLTNQKRKFHSIRKLWSQTREWYHSYDTYLHVPRRPINEWNWQNADRCSGPLRNGKKTKNQNVIQICEKCSQNVQLRSTHDAPHSHSRSISSISILFIIIILLISRCIALPLQRCTVVSNKHLIKFSIRCKKLSDLW